MEENMHRSVHIELVYIVIICSTNYIYRSNSNLYIFIYKMGHCMGLRQ